MEEGWPSKRKRSTRSASEPPAEAEQEVEEQMLPPNTVLSSRESAGEGAGGATRVYRCLDCGRVFDSYQALGGHRSVHTPTKKSPTGAPIKKQARESPSIATNVQDSGLKLHGPSSSTSPISMSSINLDGGSRNRCLARDFGGWTGLKTVNATGTAIATNLGGTGDQLHGTFSNGSGGYLEDRWLDHDFGGRTGFDQKEFRPSASGGASLGHGRQKGKFGLDGNSDLLPENLRGLGGIKANQYGIVRFNTNSSSCNMWSGAIECGIGVSCTSSTSDYSPSSSSDHQQRWDGGGRKSEPHAIASGHEVSHEPGFLNLEATNDATLPSITPHPVNSTITSITTTQVHADQQQGVGTSCTPVVEEEDVSSISEVDINGRR